MRDLRGCIFYNEAAITQVVAKQVVAAPENEMRKTETTRKKNRAHELMHGCGLKKKVGRASDPEMRVQRKRHGHFQFFIDIFPKQGNKVPC